MNLLECFLIGMRTKLMSLMKRLIEVLVLEALCVCMFVCLKNMLNKTCLIN